MSETISISQLMNDSGVKFGTSGARGLATDMTDRVCYAYTFAFLQHLESIGDIQKGTAVAIAGDFRPSSPRIMAAAAKAITDFGCNPINCGFIPSPAVALYGIEHGSAAIMVTGSHIPDDRNGIKFNKPAGEILKQDEQGISALSIKIPTEIFGDDGNFSTPYDLGPENNTAYQNYIKRYLDFFPQNCLAGYTVGVYEHSSVAREAMKEILNGLGAMVISLGRSETFIPVDTEAVRPEDIELAKQWASEQKLDCIVSADGDGDRPLVSDENGNWLRGDVAGILCARYLNAKAVATPVSSNSALEKSGWFERVDRTRIGSPFVIAAMEQALNDGSTNVVGYEANGGFLIASDIQSNNTLKALPTRDAVIVHLSILMSAINAESSISEIQKQLPPRFTSSDRLKEFPTELSQARISQFNSGDFDTDKQNIEAVFGEQFGSVKEINSVDGVRITFDNDEVVHLRPSGNAPELRCYNEAASEARALEINKNCMAIMAQWRD